MLRFLGIVFALIVMFAPGQAHAVCGSPSGNPGDIVYNQTEKLFQYCSDNVWRRMNTAPGSGTGGCTSPTLDEGQMVFNADHRVLQGCAGSIHRPMSAVGGVNKWLDISLGFSALSCGLRSDHKILCWGNNPQGIGNGTTLSASPALLSSVGTNQWKTISVGETSACGIQSNNSLWCWGHNLTGQLGDGTSTSRSTPVSISGGGQWKKVVASAFHTCGIKMDNTAWCWGLNNVGQAGTGATGGTYTSPQAVVGSYTWTDISLDANATCGIQTNGTAWCWGSGSKLGNGGGTASNSPVAVSGGFTWKKLSSGYNHTCGLRSDDNILCWANNSSGQLGDGTTNSSLSPVPLSGGGTWKDMNAKSGSTICGIKSDDTVWCWGDIVAADGMSYITTTPTQDMHAGGTAFKSIYPGFKMLCGIDIYGGLKCRGNGLFYIGIDAQMGRADIKGFQEVPVGISSGGQWKQVSIGYSHTCAIKSDDTLWCWGQNYNTDLTQGLLGNNTRTDSSIPVAVSGGGTWKKVSASNSFSCAIKSDDTLHCWGSNGNGRTAQNTITASTIVPTAVSGGGTWKDIATGDSHACGILMDDTIRCWGNNGSGRLGDNTITQRLAPTALTSTGGWDTTTWKSVTTGSTHTCAIRSDDVLYCWGNNGSGQLGDGTPTQRLLPTALTATGNWNTATWKNVSAGNLYTCAIRSDDSAYCWGSNTNGRLGDGTVTPTQSPIAVSGGNTWTSIKAATDQTCARKTSGQISCWGNNTNGQLGNGTLTQSTVPIAVEGNIIWQSFDNKYGASCGINAAGSILCWGQNTNSKLTNNEISSPYVQTAALINCSDPVGKAGSIVYNSASNIMQYCDGAGWVGIAGGVAPPIQEGLPTSGLIAYWKFDETSGATIAADSSGNGNHGALNSMDPASDWVPGRVGNALDFDGSDDRVEVLASASINDLGNRTVCFWSYPRVLGGSNRIIVSKYDNSFNVGWDVYQNGSATSMGGVGYNETASSTDNVWQHYCTTRSGSTLTIYKNGVIVPGATGAYGSAGSDAAYNLYIGRDNSGDPFNGMIDELRIYNRVLTLTEIQALAAQ